MEHVLLTGAAGDIGTPPAQAAEAGLSGAAAERHQDAGRPAPGETFVAADLARIEEVAKAVDGVDSIIHLGGYSVEGPWETILQANIIGCYNLFEAARQGRQARDLRLVQPRRRLLSALPPHRHRRHGAARQPLRRQQGVRRGAGRALCRQARHARDLPPDRQCRAAAARRAAAVDLDLARGHRAADPHRAGASRHPLRDLLRRVGQRAGLVGQLRAPRLRLSPDRQRRGPSARMPRPSRPRSRPIRSATSSRAALSAAPSSTPIRPTCGSEQTGARSSNGLADRHRLADLGPDRGRSPQARRRPHRRSG